MLNCRYTPLASIILFAACSQEVTQNNDDYLGPLLSSEISTSDNSTHFLSDDPSVSNLAKLSLDTGNSIIVNSVQLPDGSSGIEVFERGKPGAPSIASIGALDNASPLEVFNALASPMTDVRKELSEQFEAPQLGPQGWLRSQWSNFKPDIERYSCGNSWFNDQCFGHDTYNHSSIRYNWNGSYAHQKTGPITRYRSRACNQGSKTSRYRIRRKNQWNSSYINWTISSFDPGEYFTYRWTSSSGVYRFRTEVAPNSGSSSGMQTDICVRYDLLADNMTAGYFCSLCTIQGCACSGSTCTECGQHFAPNP